MAVAEAAAVAVGVAVGLAPEGLDGGGRERGAGGGGINEPGAWC